MARVIGFMIIRLGFGLYLGFGLGLGSGLGLGLEFPLEHCNNVTTKKYRCIHGTAGPLSYLLFQFFLRLSPSLY